jgi:uncharacterized protein (TIGR00730 family)
MKSLCVYCGSSLGDDPSFASMARLLGYTIAKSEITLVYGGANVGLMGTVADSVLDHGGKVIGVLPKFLVEKEIAHTGLTELILCETMHERKTKLFELSQGFIALPGGFGTLEEIFEVLTWQQLGLHKFPIAFLNINGFFDHLRSLFDEMECKKLLKPQHKNMVIFGNEVPAVLDKMRGYRGPEVAKWISEATT